MHEARSARLIAFPKQDADLPAGRPRVECLVTTSPGRLGPEELPELCSSLVCAFEEKHGFALPRLIFREDPRLGPTDWCLHMNGRELHQGKLAEPARPAEVLAGELLNRAWKFFTYDLFRTLLEELGDREPFLIEEVKARLDLVSTWQALQTLLRQGGTLHRLSDRLERVLIEADGRNREQAFSPRMLSALRQP